MSQKSKQTRKFYNRNSQRNSDAPASSPNPYPLDYNQYIPPPPNYAYNNAPHMPMSYPYPNPDPYYPNAYPPPPQPPHQPYPYPESDVTHALRLYLESLRIPERNVGIDNPGAKNTDGKKKGKGGGSIPSKGQRNPPNKGQPRPQKKPLNQGDRSESLNDVTARRNNLSGQPNLGSKTVNKPMPLMPTPKDNQNVPKLPMGMTVKSKNKGQGSSAKSQVETHNSGNKNFDDKKKGTKNFDGKKKRNDGGSTPLKGQPNPTNKGQRRPSKNTLNQGDRSASLNDVTAHRNSLPKGQPKLVKIVPPQGNLKKGENKPKVGNLHVIINSDKDIIQLSKHLEKRLKNKIKFQVKSAIKDETTGYMNFQLEFESGNKTTSAMRVFHASNKNNDIKIECKRADADKQSQKKPDTLRNKLRCQNDTVLQKHDKKIENVRNEITSLMSSVGDTSSLKETKNSCVKALEHKEIELLFQLAEYKKAQKDLEMQLKTLEKDKKDDSPEGKKVVKRLFQEQKFLSEELPLYASRSELTKIVLENQVTILTGNSGSGKSTQLVQYLMETSLVDDGPIVVTEPSETLAISTARHVAGEVKSSLGDLVGFSSEKDIHMNIYTNVLFMSELELINQFRKIKSFEAYSCIVIDEVQEKTVYADLLLGLLKLELIKIPRLRIVIVAAPMEMSLYQTFFTESVSLEVKSCLFPVQVIWSHPNETQLFENAAIEKAIEIHCQEDEGDILVFVASVAEVLKCCNDFKSSMKKNNYVCLALYDGISYDQLKSIYRPLSKGKRKIIFATSFAEVMKAVPNVKYVIDNGIKKEKFLESGDKNELQISFISQDSAELRKEKAGSSFAGKCYRLYSPNDLQGMKATDPDEMSLIGSMEKVVVNLLKLEIDPMKFQFPTRVLERISNAIKYLENLGVALNDSGKYKLTDLGAKIFKLPFRFHINWMLLEGIKRRMEMESVALATLSNLKQEVFCIEAKYNEMMQIKHQEFGPRSESIALRTLRVLAEWYRKPKKEKESWCIEHCLDNSTLKLINSQMTDLCQTLATDLKLDVHFTPLQTINNSDDLEKLMNEALTEINSSMGEHN